MTEPRPHRRAGSHRTRRARRSIDEVVAGRLDARRGRPRCSRLPACAAARRRARSPAGLTAREVEVLRLVARGLSNKEIAAQLRPLAQDRRPPRRPRLRQARRLDARGGGALRGRARAARPIGRSPDGGRGAPAYGAPMTSETTATRRPPTSPTRASPARPSSCAPAPSAPRELVELCLERIERLDPRLNAFRVVRGERRAAPRPRPRRRAWTRGERAPLLGVPIAVKDNMDVAGELTTHGTGVVGEPAARGLRGRPPPARRRRRHRRQDEHARARAVAAPDRVADVGRDPQPVGPAAQHRRLERRQRRGGRRRHGRAARWAPTAAARSASRRRRAGSSASSPSAGASRSPRTTTTGSASAASAR